MSARHGHTASDHKAVRYVITRSHHAYLAVLDHRTLWDQFAALLPERVDSHPLGCHRRRIPDRIVFDKLLCVLVFGGGFERIADTTCSDRTLRRRRDEWTALGVQ